MFRTGLIPCAQRFSIERTKTKRNTRATQSEFSYSLVVTSSLGPSMSVNFSGFFLDMPRSYFIYPTEECHILVSGGSL